MKKIILAAVILLGPFLAHAQTADIHAPITVTAASDGLSYHLSAPCLGEEDLGDLRLGPMTLVNFDLFPGQTFLLYVGSVTYSDPGVCGPSKPFAFDFDTAPIVTYDDTYGWQGGGIVALNYYRPDPDNLYGQWYIASCATGCADIDTMKLDAWSSFEVTPSTP